MLYEKHCLDKDYQNKINEITKYMLNTNNKGNNSSNSTFDNSDNSFDFKVKSNKHLNIEKIELLKDLLGKETNNDSNHNKMNSSHIPRFQNNSNKNSSEIPFIHEGDEPNKDEQLIRMNSSESKFTFMDKNQNNKKEKLNEKIKEKEKENIENKNDNIISNDINDYITSVPMGSFLKKINHIKKRNIYKSCKDLTSKNYLDSKAEDFSLSHDEEKPLHENSEKLVMSEDSKMYADLLEIIYELYKNGKISFEQKVNLKKLIIIKCPKILNVYEKFQNVDREKLTEKLKELV